MTTSIAEAAPRFLLPENKGNLIVGCGTASPFKISGDFLRGILVMMAMADNRRTFRKYLGRVKRWEKRLAALEAAGRGEEAAALLRRRPTYRETITTREVRAWLRRGRKKKNSKCRRRK